MTLGNPNGATPQASSLRPAAMRGQTRGTETSNYPEEKKSTEIPSVAASEAGRAQTAAMRGRQAQSSALASEVRWKAAPERVTAPYDADAREACRE